MKTAFFFLFMTTQVLASESFNVTSTDPEVDLSSLQKDIKVRSLTATVQKGYLSVPERDVILNKHLKDKIKVMDEFDRAILYKSIISYDEKTLLTKYPFLKGLKNDLL